MTMEATENPLNETEKSQSKSNDNNNQTKVEGNDNAERQPPQGNSSPETTDKDSEDHNQMKEDADSELDVLDLEDTSDYNADERSSLFQKGLEYEKKNKYEQALKCYFGCMKGLKRKTNFVLLPECLHNIADIYQTQGNYERAIHFAQAEKLFYESALIETQEIQNKIEEVAGTEANRPARDINELNIEAMRADEYEHLARLCLDKNQAQLALEYAGKCAKIRQLVFGDNHPKTKETLDFFASLYAEVGKEQYSDSFTLLDKMTTEEYQAPEVIMSPSAGGEPVSILRHRNLNADEKKEDTPVQAEREKKQVRFHESVEDNSQREREELVSLTVTLMLLVVCFIILLALGLWLYCAIDRGQMCHYMGSKLQSWIMNVRYLFHSPSMGTNTPKTAYPR